MHSLRSWCAAGSFFVSMSASAGIPYCPPSLETSLEGDAIGTFQAFPRGHLFQPLLADPKEPRFFFSFREYERSAGRMHVGVIGFGESFALFRRAGGCANDGLQLDIVGGGVARFVLDESRNDLLDADYNVALPLSWRRGNWSLRTRIYHESAHLGEDELFRVGSADRLKRSYEAGDLLISFDEEKWRVYFGGEYFFRHHPQIDHLGLHLGTEYYGPRVVFEGAARWVTALDVKAYEEFGYEADLSFRTGLSFGGWQTNQNYIQLMLEWYDGHANTGVLFDEEYRYIGAAIYFGF